MYITYEELKELIKYYQQEAVNCDPQYIEVYHLMSCNAIPGQVFIDLENEGVINSTKKDWVANRMYEDETICFKIVCISHDDIVLERVSYLNHFKYMAPLRTVHYSKATAM